MTIQHPGRTQTTAVSDFAAFLLGHIGGRSHELISEEFHQLLAAVAEHGKKGSLAIKITVEPPKGAVDGGPVAIAIESDLKAPRASMPPAIYFVDDDGNASRHDPRQIALDFRTAPATTEYKDR